MSVFSIKKGDTSPAILAELTPQDVDITGATGVVFNMWDRSTKTVKINRAAASLVTASGPASVSYAWALADTDTDGWFEAEFEVTRADGTVETFPNDGYISVNITRDIG
ncbi:hypothetical protein [Hoeflea sp.]|uniref:hypothetical protein n=1 Tax=Hoeflea sp. TaxID=1940281 RepID=UPI0019B9939D|nr:hypothetical protein [Hoeflea sp.]MBC7282582.1 hypothetical protein [Hoeflea sp.]